MKRIALALGVVALLATSAGSASAAPTGAPSAQRVTATCPATGGSTVDVDVVVNGNGAFPAVHVVNSTTVFVPVWFGPTTVTGDDGSVEAFPEGPKGSAVPKGHPLITCSWTGEPESVEGVSYTASGTVSGFFA